MLPSMLELGIAKNRSLIGQSYLIILALKVVGVLRRSLGLVLPHLSHILDLVVPFQ